MVGLHAFTGCDTDSAFAGRRKPSALKQMKAEQTFQEAFIQLGQSWKVPQELFETIQKFTGNMCLPSTHTSQVNHLQYVLFCVKREVEPSQLPPCRDNFFIHVHRASVQAAIWRCQPFVPSPYGCAWNTDDDDRLTIEWMRGSPAPNAVLELLSCRCPRCCKLPDCQCLLNGRLKCTDLKICTT